MGLDKCKIVELPKIMDRRGNLTFIEKEMIMSHLILKEYIIFMMSLVVKKRGGHAHKALQQFIIAASGSFDVVLDDGYDQKRFHLNRSYYGLYIPTMIWRELDNFSSGSVCIVLASEHYDENDYIRDYQVLENTVGSNDKK